MLMDFAPDKKLFPFESRWYDGAGPKVHYVDEGQGRPVVMFHGNPTWSFRPFPGNVSGWHPVKVQIEPAHGPGWPSAVRFPRRGPVRLPGNRRQFSNPAGRLTRADRVRPF